MLLVNKSLISFLILLAGLLASLTYAQNEYLDEAGWEWFNNSSQFFNQAFSMASTGAVPTAISQQYSVTLTQLFEASVALESDLRDLQGQYQQTTGTIPFDLVYLTTSVGALSSAISSLTDYYQQLQSPTDDPINLQNALRLAHLNNTIYWLSLTLYYEKSQE